jgi:16S rRNA G966 N2-methylase RsmD
MSTSQFNSSALFGSAESTVPPDAYFADAPNPCIRAFVDQHQARTKGGAVSYNVPAFAETITTDKDNAVYGIHGYWSKKPYDAIRQYIRHYTQPGDLVLDPFSGSGTTAIAAAAEGRDCIAVDLSGAATFIARHGNRVLELVEQLASRVRSEMAALYTTVCDRCNGPAEIAFTVWSNTYQCLKCMEVFPIYDASEARLCPHCGDPLAARSPYVGTVPVETGYDCLGSCKPRRSRRSHRDHDSNAQRAFAEKDVALIQRIASEPIRDWFPTDPFCKEWVSYRPNLGEAKTIAGFFTKRNLRACARIMAGIGELETAGAADADVLRFCFTAALLNFSRKAQHLEEGGGYIPGNYNFPPLTKERHVWRSFESVATKVAKGMDAIANIRSDRSRVLLSTGSAFEMTDVPTSSIDFIFTDPPYSNKVPFGEFNFLYESWLKFRLSWKSPEELIENNKLGKPPAEWERLMTRAAREMFRVLKPGRWVSLCYHDSAEGSWEMLQDSMAAAGFVPDQLAKVISIEVRNKSFKQRTTAKVQKRDLVVNFRKPAVHEFGDAQVVIPESADARTFRDLAREVIREYLQANPASTRDRVFDELVSRMVRAGQMQAHNFDELLREVADETKDAGGAGRWYLKESEEGQIDAAEAAKEDSASKAMEKFIAKTLDKNYAEGVHYSDLFEHYLYAVKDKPRRSLADWLPDYFFKTEDGTWRLPVDDEERELKATARASGENRRIKRYAAMLQAGVAVPKERVPSAATLAEWIRHAKRSGLYEAGKLLYERGGLDASKLSEEQQVEVEEDYQVCVRALQRAAGGEATAAPKKRGRKKKTETGE